MSQRLKGLGRGPLFAAAALLFALALIALIVIAVTGGDFADAGDDLLTLAFALAALGALIGWYRERAAAARAAAQAAEQAEAGLTAVREQLGQRETELGNARTHAEESDAELGRERERIEALETQGEQDRGTIEQRDSSLHRERQMGARVQRAREAEREWTRELRSQMVRLHREQGPIGHSGDVRQAVLEVALKLVEAEKGLLLSREDEDGDGRLDLVCSLNFDNATEDSVVAQEFAGRVLEREATVREDDSSTLRQEGRTAADAEIRNLLAIPIYVQDEFSGVVVCANREGGFEELDDDVLLSLGDHAGAVLENGRLHGALRSSYLATVRMLAEAIEAKDPGVRLHSDEVAGYVSAVAERLALPAQRREELLIGSLLHDVGKIGISERILLKPGALSAEERSTIELHPRIGYRLVQQVPALEPIAAAVLHHHERYDGDGYPSGLRGEQIPLEARVIGVADSFSAMTSDRPYRAPLSLDEACEELERCAGSQFDPQVVMLFVEEVRKRPASVRDPAETGAALADPELAAHRVPGEAVLGAGQVAVTDNLTLLYSHRYLHELAQAQATRAALQGHPFTVVLCELAGLPEVNARDGYAAGDAVIQDAARATERAAGRAGGTACRYGGGRLAIVLPETSTAAGDALCVELEAELAPAGTAVVSAYAEWEPGETGTAVIARARLALALGAARPPTG